MSNRVAVLGSQGLVGRAVTGWLRQQRGITVLPIARSPGAGEMRFDAADLADIAPRLAAWNPIDVAVNCVGVVGRRIAPNVASDLLEATQINTDFPLALGRACRDAGIRLIHVSTDAVFAPDSGPVTEVSAPNPTDDYGRSKLAGEPDEPTALSIRCSVVGFHPTKKDGLIERTLRSWASGQPVEASDAHRWSGSTVLQLAQWITRLLNPEFFMRLRRTTRVVHFAPNGTSTRYALLSSLNASAAAGGRLVAIGMPIVSRELHNDSGIAPFVPAAGQPWTVVLHELMAFEHGLSGRFS